MGNYPIYISTTTATSSLGDVEVDDIDIKGNIYYNNTMLTFCGDSTTTQCYVNTGVTYQDWLLVNMVLLFLVVFIPLGLFFNLLKKKYIL